MKHERPHTHEHAGPRRYSYTEEPRIGLGSNLTRRRADPRLWEYYQGHLAKLSREGDCAMNDDTKAMLFGFAVGCVVLVAMVAILAQIPR